MAMTSTHKAWRLHAYNDLRFEDVETPQPAPDGVLIRIEAGMVLSYMGRVLSGAAPYSMPPMPFVPGTNAIGRVLAIGENVTYVGQGDRVFLSPHLRGDVPDAEPPQILIGLTATMVTEAALALQSRWRDGVFAEIAHWPAGCGTRACAAAIRLLSTAQPAISALGLSCSRPQWAQAAWWRPDARQRRWS